jgi:hypothetical protein
MFFSQDDMGLLLLDHAECLALDTVSLHTPN